MDELFEVICWVRLRPLKPWRTQSPAHARRLKSAFTASPSAFSTSMASMTPLLNSSARPLRHASALSPIPAATNAWCFRSRARQAGFINGNYFVSAAEPDELLELMAAQQQPKSRLVWGPKPL
jgi:hypothetical protein